MRKIAEKLPRKREFLIVQVEFGNTIGIKRTELCRKCFKGNLSLDRKR